MRTTKVNNVVANEHGGVVVTRGGGVRTTADLIYGPPRVGGQVDDIRVTKVHWLGATRPVVVNATRPVVVNATEHDDFVLRGGSIPMTLSMHARRTYVPHSRGVTFARCRGDATQIIGAPGAERVADFEFEQRHGGVGQRRRRRVTADNVRHSVVDKHGVIGALQRRVVARRDGPNQRVEWTAMERHVGVVRGANWCVATPAEHGVVNDHHGGVL